MRCWCLHAFICVMKHNCLVSLFLFPARIKKQQQTSKLPIDWWYNFNDIIISIIWHLITSTEIRKTTRDYYNAIISLPDFFFQMKSGRNLAFFSSSARLGRTNFWLGFAEKLRANSNSSEQSGNFILLIFSLIPH